MNGILCTGAATVGLAGTAPGRQGTTGGLTTLIDRHAVDRDHGPLRRHGTEIIIMSLTEQKKYTPPEKDELYDLLSNHRRRYVIHFCKQADEPLTLSDLAEMVAAREQDKSVPELTSAERKRVYTSLQQTHLDRLTDAGMIEYDGDEVELTEEAQTLDVYLDIVPEGSIPWGIYYLGLSLLSVVVLGGVWIGFVPTETVPEIGWAAGLVAVFLASSVAQVIHNRRYRLCEIDLPP